MNSKIIQLILVRILGQSDIKIFLDPGKLQDLFYLPNWIQIPLGRREIDPLDVAGTDLWIQSDQPCTGLDPRYAFSV